MMDDFDFIKVSAKTHHIAEALYPKLARDRIKVCGNVPVGELHLTKVVKARQPDEPFPWEGMLRW